MAGATSLQHCTSAVGCGAQGFIYPMEVVQTRLAVSPRGTYSGISDALSKIVRLEGSRALFRGLTPTMIGILPYAGALPAEPKKTVDMCQQCRNPRTEGDRKHI